jgi:tetratricopeptide (TPR) repeat protein
VEGNLTAAERDLSRAVAISDSIATSLDLAAALHNLAAVEMHTRRLREATVHETKALAIWRQQLGDRHYYVMKAWISLSSLQGLSNAWRAAESSLRKALDIAETPEALANYAVVLEKLKRGKEGQRDPWPVARADAVPFARGGCEGRAVRSGAAPCEVEMSLACTGRACWRHAVSTRSRNLRLTDSAS